MFNSSVLDVAIGLIFVYLLLGLMCTTVNEWFAQALNTRAATLKEGIRGLLHAPPDGTYLIRPVDINVAALTSRLSDPADKLTVALSPIPTELSNLIATHAQGLKETPPLAPPEGLAAALARRLSDVLSMPDLKEKVDDSKVTPETKAALAKPIKGTDLLRLNRALLTEAYPGEISSLSDAFYSHPLIKSLARPGKHPSYVPSKTFALTLMDIFTKGQTAAADATASLNQIKSAIAALPDSDVKVSLQALMRSGGASVEEVQKTIEDWFEGSMDRVSGWYKKRTQVWTIVIASIVTIFVNADTITITQKLMINPTLREKIVQEAAATAKDNKDKANAGAAPAQTSLTDSQKSDLASLTGWTEDFRTFHHMEFLDCKGKAGQDAAKVTACEAAEKTSGGTFPGLDLLVGGLLLAWIWAVVPGHLAGWILTAVASSLGAPFWFDLLNKFMNVRSVGASPDEKKAQQAALAAKAPATT